MDFIPKLFIDGTEYKVILTDRSCDELCISNQLSIEQISYNLIKWIHELDATKMIANIFRYANGQSLKEPEYLNDERTPFHAFKYKTPPKNETFSEFRKRCELDQSIMKDMLHLRAYFWYEMKYLTEDYQEENLIILSHFIIKETRTMTEENVTICRNQKHKFDSLKGRKYV